MVSSIVLIGNIPDWDSTVIRQTAGAHDFTIHVIGTLDELSESLRAGSHAYISYLPCTRQCLLELFATLPLGAAEHFPLFISCPAKIPPECIQEFPLSGIFETPITGIAAENILNAILFFNKISNQNSAFIEEIEKYRKQKYQLVKLSMALTSQYDLGALLDLILKESLDILNADAGSIYIRERTGPGRSFIDKLRFKVSKNYSIHFEPGKEFTIDIDKNRIAGFVAYTGQILNIKDVYALDDSVPYKFSKDIDQRFHYRMKSMLTVPLKNVAGEVVGVLQVMNKKKKPGIILSSPEVVAEYVIDFSYLDEELMRSIGSLAAVSIERTQLYENIEMIFEGFLDASITAIDERDRVTSGHSRRVMGYAMRFADAINKTRDGVFGNIYFTDDKKRQFKFAALLHDIGKIGVPEGLLTKETRLPGGTLAAILMRLEHMQYLIAAGDSFMKTQWHAREELIEARQFFERINKAGALTDAEYDQLLCLRKKQWKTADGVSHPLLTDEEWNALSVRKGNLTAQERNTINSHAASSFRILSTIPWVPALENIPLIAAHHHEMLDGSGYPDGLRNNAIPLEARILTVVDIYDALVSQDRPYKPAMRPAKALEILTAEARAGRLDPNIVTFFIDKEVYTLFNPERQVSQ